MAAGDLMIVDGTPHVWADTTDYSSTVSSLARTDQLDLTSIATTAARQGDKGDLGAIRARSYGVLVSIEFAVAPVSKAIVSFWWAGSPITTAANANPGGCSGSDAAYTGTAGDSIADSIAQLIHMGNLSVTADATAVVQYGVIGILDGASLPRYGMPVVVNETTQAFHADAVECYVALLPLKDQYQSS